MKANADIREFVQGLLAGYGDADPLADDDSLLSSGRLQSIDAVEIAMFLEGKYGIDFARIGFDKDRIDSIDAIYTLVQTAMQGN